MLAYDPTVQAAATRAAQDFNAYQTATALTPRPTFAPNPFPTPLPTPTFAIGMIVDGICRHRVHPGEIQIESCWHTQVNGTWILVGAGFDGVTPDDIHGARADEVNWRGQIWVCTEPCGDPMAAQLYPAPRPDLHISAVDGPRITLAARDPSVPDLFIFDISTLQWIPPLPTPTP
jgi:hypothetical protein